ncbi:ribosome small subunit-dependent GTPase A [Flagellimonas eckloniae]|uniref:Small ribosomal subunit biogenesis GTPase RsgA n=1 Tax=Flagellimonas eckloniae TaxID=346185 RepID=A0A0Q0XGL9_9FLAO|nr:ribosome small subunit-dependent GTPase A [Allomuricauda eckloniae]KQC30241.1 ribosome biogenesis GTPase RsgA [Allomuricauda eckloniae]
MKMEVLGYNDTLEKYRKNQNLDSFEVGRVILEHKERYVVKTHENEFDSELIGNLRFTAENRYDFPAVGDWVAFSSYDDNKALIHAIYPRKSIIERKAVGKSSQVQIIATNVDFGLIVQAVDRDFNLNRLERYLTICNTSKVMPIIVLSKTDLIAESVLDTITNQITQRITDVPILNISNQGVKKYQELEAVIKNGKTYCLLGSSGVGKSTLLNGLSGKLLMKTNEISSSVNKGKHTTSHRELIVLNNGGIMIDNPGMREIGITNATDGLEITFESIFDYSRECRFNDCTHVHENGCAILKAVENGEIDEEAYINFQKMEKEKTHFESGSLDRKMKDKNLGKMIKNIKKQRRSNKY